MHIRWPAIKLYQKSPKLTRKHRDHKHYKKPANQKHAKPTNTTHQTQTKKKKQHTPENKPHPQQSTTTQTKQQRIARPINRQKPHHQHHHTKHNKQALQQIRQPTKLQTRTNSPTPSTSQHGYKNPHMLNNTQPKNKKKPQISPSKTKHKKLSLRDPEYPFQGSSV